MTSNIQQLFDALPPEQSGREWVRLDCPHCVDKVGKDDRKRCLAINTESGWFGCWRCKVRGRIDVGERLQIRPPPETFSDSNTMSLPNGFEPIYPRAGVPAQVLEPHRRYLEGRGISKAVCQAANVGGVIGNNYWLGRVLVPVERVDGTLAGWSARAINDQVEPKYRYPKGFKRATALFNKSILSVPTKEPAFVVEGVFDALALWPHAVAVLGKPTNAQEEIITRANRPLCIALDGDAWQEGWAFAMRLRVRGCFAIPVKLPPCEDPATLGYAWLCNAYSSARTDVKNGD